MAKKIHTHTDNEIKKMLLRGLCGKRIPCSILVYDLLVSEIEIQYNDDYAKDGASEKLYTKVHCA